MSDIAAMPATMETQSPFEVDSDIKEPSPVATIVLLPHDVTSATMLAFQAPPAAVTAPVTSDGKIAGKMK